MSTDVFDKTVGDIAGAIYSDIAASFLWPPLMLIPPITFKVRKVLEHFTDISLLSAEQKKALADDLRVAIVPMLFSYELDPDKIDTIGPLIEAAALKALGGIDR